MSGAAFRSSYIARASLASVISSFATSLDLSNPSSAGYVVLSLVKSLPAVLPSCSVVAVMSRMSSTTYTHIESVWSTEREGVQSFDCECSGGSAQLRFAARSLVKPTTCRASSSLHAFFQMHQVNCTAMMQVPNRKHNIPSSGNAPGHDVLRPCSSDSIV